MVQYKTTLRHSEAGYYIELPTAFLNATKWADGDALTLTDAAGGINITPWRPTLAELMAQVPEGGLPSIEQLEGIDTAALPAGRESL